MENKNARESTIWSAYSDPQQLEALQPQEHVAIVGFGLSAMDLMCSLTLGKGGRFVRDEKGVLQYQPSGREPKLTMFSASGLPYRGRPELPNGNPVSYQPAFFTYERVDQLRAAHATGKLNFEQELLPLLYDEMKLRYYMTMAFTSAGDEASVHVREELVQAWQEGRYPAALEKQASFYGPFDPLTELHLTWPQVCRDAQEYQSAFCELVWEDLRGAQAGVHGSPVKAALELFRDLRAIMRYAVDHAGLEPESHLRFTNEYNSLMNRTVAGPQKERLEELLTLVEAGILDIPFGPAPRVVQTGSKFRITSTCLEEPFTAEVDRLCLAYVGQPSVDQSASELLQNLYANGRIRPFYNEETRISGIDLDANRQPVNQRGETERHFWVLGPLAEGVQFYNHYVPTPNSRSKAYHDANACVSQFFERVLHPAK